VTCRIIGDGPDRGALEAQAVALGVAGQIEFRHDVAGHDELFALLKAGQVFAFPSEREGFGIAVLEALACGLPVVTTSAPDNLARHLVARAPSGVITAPERVAFADALAAALDAGVVGAEPDAWLADYDWTTVTRRVAEAVAA
jgi:glycosyltransferase involved in cell wall biosynthesis